MTVLLTLVSFLLAAQLYSRRAARRHDASRLMRPADEWEPEDVDSWLALIEPFPLHDPTREPK